MPDITPSFFCFFFFNDTATTEIYTLSLHDALPICQRLRGRQRRREESRRRGDADRGHHLADDGPGGASGVLLRSEEHTSELQSLAYLVCRLLLEKKKKKPQKMII